MSSDAAGEHEGDGRRGQRSMKLAAALIASEAKVAELQEALKAAAPYVEQSTHYPL